LFTRQYARDRWFMSESPETIRSVRQWVEKAEHDLIAAEHTLTLEENCPLDTICFHTQQCAEKYIKAFLVQQSIGFPKTHDLRALMQLIPLDLSLLGLDKAEVLKLNRYTIEARYPGEWEPITREETEQAVAIAKSVRAAVRAYLHEDVLDK
jgi:HEPN domain-containing protein